MAVITKTIQQGEESSEVTEIQKALISLGANITPGELFNAASDGTYGTGSNRRWLPYLTASALRILHSRLLMHLRDACCISLWVRKPVVATH